MRVAIYITPKFFHIPTGQMKHAMNMALCLSRQPGFEVILLAASDQLKIARKIAFETPLNKLPVVPIPLPSRLVHYLWRTFYWPPADHWCGKVDWVYSPMEVFVPAKNARIAATIHCAEWFEKNLPWSDKPENRRARRRMNRVFRPIIRRADLICTVSEFLKDRLCELLKADPSRIAVVGNGVEEEFLAEGRRTGVNAEADSESYIVSVGALASIKGAESLIRFGRHLAQSHPRLKLVIVAGRYGDAEFIAEAERLPNVSLTGYVGSKELPRVLKNAKALVILSRYETFGIPAIEAMAAGIPVIAARSAALPEIIGEAGILVDADKPAEIVDAINSLDNTEKRERYRRLGLQRVQQYSWEACAARLSAFLKRDE